MKRRFAKITQVAVLALLLLGAYRLGARQRPVVCEVRRSPLDHQTIEVWRDGELADEWQPEDGAIYTMLDFVLRDEMPPEAQQRARERFSPPNSQPRPPSTPGDALKTSAADRKIKNERAQQKLCCARFASIP